MKQLNKQLANIQKELKAPKNQYNSFGKYSYRSCEDILEAIKPLLGELTLTISDDVIAVGDRVYVKATVSISDGENTVSVSASAREAENKKGMDDAQITGSASSYARKYALNGLFCIDDTKDADSTNDHGKRTATPKAASEVFKQPEWDNQAEKVLSDEEKDWLDDANFDLKVVPWLKEGKVKTAKSAMFELRKKYKVANKYESLIEKVING